tara:strand:+ start:512 stop:694 length:183 start_codon:yes stop_codon:yes gene_type:complete
MFNPGDLVKAKIIGGEALGVVIEWAASRKGMDLWWVMINGKRSQYYFSSDQLTIVSKANA